MELHFVVLQNFIVESPVYKLTFIGIKIFSMLHRYFSHLKNCQNSGTAAKSHDKIPLNSETAYVAVNDFRENSSFENLEKLVSNWRK